MSATLQFGRILPGYKFRTPDGEFFLSAAPANATAKDAKLRPFSDIRELETSFAVVRGEVVGETIRACALLEVVPPITSAVLARLVDANKGIRDKVLTIAREARDELVGTLPPVAAKEKPLAVAPSGPRPICALDIGHSKSRAGAQGTLNGMKVSEFPFNTELASMVAAKVKNAQVVITSRPDTADGYLKLPGVINALNPNFAISLHANGNGSTTTGTEVLHWHASSEGKRLAAILLKEFLGALGLHNRGLKPRTANDRGGTLLQKVHAPIVIGEPFFITNPSDLSKATAGKDRLAAAYANAIDEYAASFSNPSETATSSKIVTSHVAPGSTDFQFDTNHLTKEQFLKKNDKELMRLIGAVNVRLTNQYGGAICPLTRHDVWVLTYCEAGLRNGKVDPDHRHSEGERGVLPLPDNVKSWNGNDAPVWNKPMPVARNLEHFYLYLGQLKNKDVTGNPKHFYRSLFRIDKIAGKPVREAKILAGVVHGYFYGGNYTDRKVPIDHLVKCYQTDGGLAKMMKNTTYVHAGTDILVNREANIETALGLV